MLQIPFTYFGTSDFSCAILQGLIASGHTPKLVVSTVPKPSGRGLKRVKSPVAQLTQRLGLPLIEVTTLKAPEIKQTIAAPLTPFALLAAFGKIIPSTILKLYPLGIINVHPSLLPLYRGPSPIQSALQSGEHVTGVTLITLDEEVDHGPILAQTHYTITPTDDALTLSQKLALTSIELLVKTLPDYLTGRLTPKAQNHEQATFTSMITRNHGRANFTHTATELNQQRRAFTPWPGLWTTWQGKRVKLIETAVTQAPPNLIPGQLILHNERLMLGCTQSALEVKVLQLEGGKPLSASDALRGHPQLNGAQFE